MYSWKLSSDHSKECTCINTYIRTYTHTHTNIYIYILCMDPQVFHEDSGSRISHTYTKYTNLQCKILQTFYKNSTMNHI